MPDQATFRSAPFAINPEMRLKTLEIGHEQNSLILIDDLFDRPEELTAYAKATPPFQPVSGDLYPGMRKPLPAAYGDSLLLGIAAVLQNIFNIPPTRRFKTDFCALSLSTCPPKDLLPIQRIPHFDTCNSNQFAALLYLCPAHHGGTSFYRHRSTAFEAIPKKRAIIYAKALEQEAETTGLPGPYYINGDTALFERTASIGAQYNRLVIYRSNLLHSGNIQPEHGLSDNPEHGRLTANCFITF